jgi:hypothetical protein
VTDRETFIGWIADRFQERHTPALPRGQALTMAGECLEGSEGMTAPFGDPEYAWDEAAAHDMADEEIFAGWECEP